jgi:hypothetical protein
LIDLRSAQLYSFMTVNILWNQFKDTLKLECF